MWRPLGDDERSSESSLKPLEKSSGEIRSLTGSDPSSPGGKHISCMQSCMEALKLRFDRSTVPCRMDSENWFCSNGCSCCPRVPSTNGVSFACAKCDIFRASSVWNSSAGAVTERHPVISPSGSRVGISTQSRPERVSPFAYFLSFGHSFFIYSACRMAFNFATFVFSWSCSALDRREAKNSFRSCQALSWTINRCDHASSNLDL